MSGTDTSSLAWNPTGSAEDSSWKSTSWLDLHPLLCSLLFYRLSGKEVGSLHTSDLSPPSNVQWIQSKGKKKKNKA